MTILLQTEIFLFVGRFHPLVVHLPIGFIILALFFELIQWKKKVDLNQAIAYGLLLGSIFGVFAVALGFMLSSEGGYNENTLAIHKWTGIATTVMSMIAFILKIKMDTIAWSVKAYPIVLVLTVGQLSIAGHYGGNLTHGSTYLLEHAPVFVKGLAGMKPPRERITNLDSAMAFEDVILPIFETKCNVCHNQDKSKGALLLTSAENIMAGGENGHVIVAGEPTKSELVRRITLDPNHKEFMPTEGRTPLTKEEVALIEWWIVQNAPFNEKVADLILSDRILGYLKEVGIGEDKSFFDKLLLPPISQAILEVIVSEGFNVRPVANGSTLIEVRYPPDNPEELNLDKLKTLLEAKENIVWLTLSDTNLQDEGMPVIGKLSNLTKLYINRTKITDKGLQSLTSLKNLTYLNVYGTKITDNSINSIAQLTALKKLFIWQTGISQEGRAKIQESIAGLESGS